MKTTLFLLASSLLLGCVLGLLTPFGVKMAVSGCILLIWLLVGFAQIGPSGSEEHMGTFILTTIAAMAIALPMWFLHFAVETVTRVAK